MDSKEYPPYHPDVMKALHVEVPTYGFEIFRMSREDSIRLFNVDRETVYSRSMVIGHFIAAGTKDPMTITVVKLVKKRSCGGGIIAFHVLLNNGREVVMWIHGNLKNTVRIWKTMEAIEHLQERTKRFEPFDFQVWEVDGAYLAFDESF